MGVDRRAARQQMVADQDRCAIQDVKVNYRHVALDLRIKVRDCIDLHPIYTDFFPTASPYQMVGLRDRPNVAPRTNPGNPGQMVGGRMVGASLRPDIAIESLHTWPLTTGDSMTDLTQALRQEAQRVAPLPEQDRTQIEQDARQLEVLATEDSQRVALLQRAATHLRTLLVRVS